MNDDVAVDAVDDDVDDDGEEKTSMVVTTTVPEQSTVHHHLHVMLSFVIISLAALKCHRLAASCLFSARISLMVVMVATIITIVAISIINNSGSSTITI